MPPAEFTESSPPSHECPECGAPLTLTHTEVSSGAFRTQAASMPQRPIYFFDCEVCGTCWKFGTRLLPDPVRQTLRDAAGRSAQG